LGRSCAATTQRNAEQHQGHQQPAAPIPMLKQAKAEYAKLQDALRALGGIELNLEE
jgi:hypothetical protein